MRLIPNRRPGDWLVVAATLVAALVVVLAVTRPWQDGSSGDAAGGVAAPGLPDTPDYHSLLVSPVDPDDVFLGTHAGLFRSVDAGVTWRQVALDGRDAMNLARASAGTLWAAGHEVLARSDDGGASWQDATAEGLPSRDVHGFAVDPARPGRLWAAIAGQGMYRSDDDGGSFTRVGGAVGGAVMALLVLPDGLLLAGDMQQGLLASRDEGGTWQAGFRELLMGLAAKPDEPRTILATGAAIFRSTDAGARFDRVLETPAGSGPIAFAPGLPTRAYVVGFDRVLYRSDDAGATWRPVTP